ncbi:MAG: phospholipase Active site motif family protein [Paucimonas sp.]|nr:phospholipase Active site motif family protein [Paucimonas sp.]
MPNATPTVANASSLAADKRADAPQRRSLAKLGLDVRTQAALEEAATGVPLIGGNRISLLFDGPKTMGAMMAAIAAATDHVHLETYIFDQDELGQRFADLLVAKQKQGVSIRILYDAVGTLGTPQEFFERMRQAGIALVAFNPVNPGARLGKWRLNNRDHRKILIVDGKIAFTGGVNISASYAKSSLFRSGHKADADVGWRDTHIRIEGPAVAALQWTFLESWALQDGAVFSTARLFPPLPAVGDKIVRVLATRPGGDHEIYKAYALALQTAEKSIHLTAAYFVPDAQTMESLVAAARRGVDVKLILPGVSDSSVVFYAGQRHFRELLAAGVKIFQLNVAVLHAKTAVIDGNWSTVGSSNIDVRSFLHNSELNVVILGDAFGQEMERAFTEDLRNAKEVTLADWDARPVSNRLREWAANLVGYWL